MLQIACVANCTFCKFYIMQIACVANCTCCKLHICKLHMMQIAHIANCTCFKLHVLQITHLFVFLFFGPKGSSNFNCSLLSQAQVSLISSTALFYQKHSYCISCSQDKKELCVKNTGAVWDENKLFFG